MKLLVVCYSILLLATAPVFAQPGPPPGAPAGGPPGMRMGQSNRSLLSPSATATVTIAGKTISIDYSSPRVRGRQGKIFTKDGLVSHEPHYPVWRAGANAATTLHTGADMTIGNLKVPAGTYTLFVNISDPAHWVLIVSKATGEWGMNYDSTKDLGRVPMQTSAPPTMVENLTYALTDNGGGKGTLALSWENVTASVPFTVH